MQQWVIQKVRIAELENYFQDHPLHPSSIIPISPNRIQSYIHNPRAKASDFAVYFIEQEKQIIAFRTVWADELRSNTTLTRFGWCSGNWVSPEHRRKGLSLFLMKEMYADWDGRLMFTNYAPESETGYLKTGLFPYKIERDGLRFYNRINLLDLYEKREPDEVKKMTLSVMGFFFNVLYRLKKILFIPNKFPGIKLSESENVSLDEFDFTHSFFSREKEEFKWIFEFPWINRFQETTKTYPFSWVEKNFAYRFVSIKNSANDEARLLISNKNGWVKTLYWNGSFQQKSVLAKWLVNYCSTHEVKVLTVLDDQFSEMIKNQRSTFVWSKKFGMHIYASFKIDYEELSVFDGDGDYIFT